MTETEPPASPQQPNSPPVAPPSDAERADATGAIVADDAESRLQDPGLNEDEVQKIGGALHQVRAPRREKVQGDMARRLKDLRDKREADEGGAKSNPPPPAARLPISKKKPRP